MRILTASLLLWGSATAQNLVISQIYGGGGNTGATFRNDFIELFNRGPEPVDATGWSVQYAGATSATWETTPIRGVILPGNYYLVQQAAGAGGTVNLPSPDATGSIAMGATAGKVAVVRSTTSLLGNTPQSSDIVDLAGYGAADFSRGMPAPTLSNTTAALRRNNGCMNTGNNAADFVLGVPNPRNSTSPANDCSIPQQPPQTATINAIQGNGATSPLNGRQVETTGIVTARRFNGFYIQSRSEDDDGDPATSEGILVFTSARPANDIQPGAMVRVTGTVAEFAPATDPTSPTLTELTNSTIAIISSGHPLPEPVLITTAELYPAGGASVLERFEGMRVVTGGVRVIAPSGGSLDEANDRASHNGIFFAVLDGTPRPFREPGIDFDRNPERLRLDTGALDGAQPVAAFMGQRAASVSGILDYGVRTYTLAVQQATFTGMASAPAAFPVQTGEYAIASMNLRRLFDTVDDPGVADVAVAQQAFEARLSRIAIAIRDTLAEPGIVAVQEVENLATLRALASRLGSAWRAYLEEGNDVGGIDVGFLVDTVRVNVASVMQEGKSATYRTPSGANATLHDRPPLVLTARIGNSTLRAVNLHLRSLLNAESPDVQAKRRAQAVAVNELAQRLQTANPNDGLIVLGDFNAFGFDDGLVDVLKLVAGDPPILIDPANMYSHEEVYTYLQDGNAQALDHVLINRTLAARLSRYQVAHINAHLPDVEVPAGAFALRRFSDHDVPLAYFAPETSGLRISAAMTVNAASLLAGSVTGGEAVTIFGNGIGEQARVIVNGAPVPLLEASTNQVTAILPFDNTTFRVQVDRSSSRSNEILLRNAGSPVPGIFSASVQDGYLAIFAVGLGSTVPPLESGTITADPGAPVVEPVSVWLAGRRLEIAYAGAAVGHLAGVYHVIANLPPGMPPGPAEVVLVAGESSSQLGVSVQVP